MPLGQHAGRFINADSSLRWHHRQRRCKQHTPRVHLCSGGVQHGWAGPQQQREQLARGQVQHRKLVHVVAGACGHTQEDSGGEHGVREGVQCNSSEGLGAASGSAVDRSTTAGRRIPASQSNTGQARCLGIKDKQGRQAAAAAAAANATTQGVSRRRRRRRPGAHPHVGRLQAAGCGGRVRQAPLACGPLIQSCAGRWRQVERGQQHEADALVPPCCRRRGTHNEEGPQAGVCCLCACCGWRCSSCALRHVLAGRARRRAGGAGRRRRCHRRRRRRRRWRPGRWGSRRVQPTKVVASAAGEGCTARVQAPCVLLGGAHACRAHTCK